LRFRDERDWIGLKAVKGYHMAKKKPQLPTELETFMKNDETTFHCDDGDWDLKIESGESSDFKSELPPRSTVIAENGCGDCLFLKTSAAGKPDAKVYVYWHEEDRDEVFAKSLKELISQSATNKARSAKPKRAPASKGKASLDELEKALASSNSSTRAAAVEKLKKSEFGIEALPLLRKALADDYISTVIAAAECIAMLGPEAATCPAGEASQLVSKPDSDHDDLFAQLMARGAQIWSYSGYANAYSACLDALVKLEYDSDDLCEFVQTHIGLSTDALLDSLEALRAVGTPEASDLARRAAAFWMPELNMSEAKKVKALLASFGTKKKK
jgi:hypothetical protein